MFTCRRPAPLTNTLIIESWISIDNYPNLDQEHPAHKSNQLTIGDLHGNALKLVYFLVKQNAINIEKTAYENLVRIYKLPVETITQEDLAQFHAIIAQLTANPVATVRLIGDEFCDRGQNDYFTLKILEKLSLLKVPVEIITSNHGIELISQFETQDRFYPPTLGYDHSSSMHNLQKLIDKGLVSRSKIDAIIKEHIKPSLRPISYTLSHEKISIYSHAAISLAEIKAMAKKLSIPYHDRSPEALAQTIDNINEKFAEYVQNDKVNELYTDDIMFDGYAGKKIDSALYPFEFAIWNRSYDQLDRPIQHPKEGYILHFIHGHDRFDPFVNYIFNLDNNLGKSLDEHFDVYKILFSQETPSKKHPQFKASECKEEKATPKKELTPEEIETQMKSDSRIQQLLNKHPEQTKTMTLLIENLLQTATLTDEVYHALLNYDSYLLIDLHIILNNLKRAELLNEKNFLAIAAAISTTTKTLLISLEKNLSQIKDVLQKECVTEADLTTRTESLKKLGLVQEFEHDEFFSNKLKKIAETREKFSAEVKEDKLGDRLQNSDLQILNSFYFLFRRLRHAGLVSPAKHKRTQDTLDKIMQNITQIPPLTQKLEAIPVLLPDAFDEAIGIKRKPPQQEHKPTHNAGLFKSKCFTEPCLAKTERGIGIPQLAGTREFMRLLN